MRFDRPLGVGAYGGHGPVRYRVSAYDPGRRIRFDFTSPAVQSRARGPRVSKSRTYGPSASGPSASGAPASEAPASGTGGYHEIRVEPLGDGRCRVVHELEERMGAARTLLWITVLRPLHSTVVEEVLDNVERVVTGRVREPVRWSRWVRLLNGLQWERARAAEIPAGARLARTAFARTDFQDAWRMSLPPGMPREPGAWEGVLRGAFPVLGRADGEILLGKDAGHLDFRASILVEEESVTLSTVVRTHHAGGRLYMAAIKPGHRLMARRMLRRTHRRLALAAPSAGERELAAPHTAGRA
ncbi:DUF2867 domain-containing protein [Streptomyces sp. MST-110588]|nr:DUF2867 domain-containing protein [Streptomyces sp. MST-110588]